MSRASIYCFRRLGNPNLVGSRTLIESNQLLKKLYQGCIQGMPQNRLCDPFLTNLLQGLPLRCLRGISNFRVETKGSSELAVGVTNQSCSFDCKWQPPMKAAILKNLFGQSE